jgi:hypothetical protein
MIVVHGATGFTGGLVCRALRARGLEFAIAGRRPSTLQSLAESLATEDDGPDVRVVSELDPADLDDALEGASVVINCAGPFVDLGKPVVEAAVRNGVHYLDTTGEQPFILDCRRQFDGAARDAGVLIAPATAFEYATGDCAAALLADHGVRDMTVFYATTGAATSRGTKKSIVRILEQEGFGLCNGELVRRAPASQMYEVEIAGRTRPALWFAAGEPVSVPNHHPDVRNVNSALVASTGAARVLKMASRAIPKIASVLRPFLDRVIEHTPSDPHRASDESAKFIVKAVDAHHRGSWVALHGEDPYSLTADIIVEAAARLHEEGAPEAGYTSVAACYDPREFMESVGVRVEDGIAPS